MTKHQCIVTAQVSICLHIYWSCQWTKKKDTGFLRFRLPVLLQQNLRCKVWDDTAKIRYIALFAISEQCSQKNLTLKLTTVLIQKKRRKKYVSIQCSASCELMSSTSTTSTEHAQRTLKRPKHATLNLCSRDS